MTVNGNTFLTPGVVENAAENSTSVTREKKLTLKSNVIRQVTKNICIEGSPSGAERSSGKLLHMLWHNYFMNIIITLFYL